MQVETGQQLQHLQEQLYYGKIGDDERDRMSTYFYDLPGTSQRRNKHIHPSGKTKTLTIVNLVDLIARSAFDFNPGAFIYPRGFSPISSRLSLTYHDVAEVEELYATTFVIADLDSESGLALAKEALLSMVPESEETAATPSRFTSIGTALLRMRIVPEKPAKYGRASATPSPSSHSKPMS